MKHDNEMQPGPPDGTSSTPSRPSDKIEEGRDYYIEGGFLVFTSEYLLGRGYCCGNGCRHCPYSSEEE